MLHFVKSVPSGEYFQMQKDLIGVYMVKYNITNDRKAATLNYLLGVYSPFGKKAPQKNNKFK